MSNRSNEQALSNPTIGGDSSNNKMFPAVYIQEARGAFFRNPGIVKADVRNTERSILIEKLKNQIDK
jgi:hypothetical protein